MSNTTLDQLLSTFDVDVTALAMCEVRSGLSLLAHPEDVTILHYVLSGTMYLTASDGSTAICPEGSVVVVSPGLGQTIGADQRPATKVLASDHASLTHDGLLRIDLADGGPGDLRFACGSLTTNLPCLSGLLGKSGGLLNEDLSGHALVRHAFQVMLEEGSTEGLGTRALSSALMKACLVLMVRRKMTDASLSSVLGMSTHSGLRAAVSVVLDQPARAHSVASLAVASGMSRSSFAKAFVDCFELTPMAFVTKTRLHHAIGLLRSTKAPIKMIAATVGFSSRSHFSRAFRDAYGADPTQFRNSGKEPSPEQRI